MTDPVDSPRTRQWRGLCSRFLFGKWGWVIIFFLALLARAGWGTFRLSGAHPAALEFPDEVQYWSMATALRAGQGLPDELGYQATRMPLFPAYLSLFVKCPQGIALAKIGQWLLGALGAVFTWGMARSLCEDRRVAVAAGLLVAFDPFLVFFSSLLLTETIHTTVLIGLWWCLTRFLRGTLPTFRHWLLVGLLAAICVYLRESSLGLIVLATVLIILYRRLAPRVLLAAGVIVSILSISLLPWAVRNRRVVGEPVFLTTRAGISLYDGVRPGATGASDLGTVKQMAAVRNLSETEWNRYFLRASAKAIRDDPLRILSLVPAKLRRTWSLVPNAGDYQSFWVRVVSVAWSVPTFALAIVSVVWCIPSKQKRGVGVLPFLLLPALYVSVMHSLFVGSLRYRLGALPMIAILASSALVYLCDRVRQRDARGGRPDLA